MSPSIVFTALRLFLAAIWLFSLFPNFCIAWSIAPDCAGFPQISEAMTEALNLAIYAKLRAMTGPPRLGTSMVDLLAAPNEDDTDTLFFVGSKFLFILHI